MGRNTGWIAVMSGIAGGADVILIPEQPITVEEACAELSAASRPREGLLDRGRERGVRADVRIRETCRAEQSPPRATSSATLGSAASGCPGAEIDERTGFETRVTVLGHVQRGGSPHPATGFSRRATA